MLSRVADSIYWMSRCVERIENLARLHEVTLNLQLDMPEETTDVWQPIVNITGDHEYFAEKYGEANEDSVFEFLTFDSEYSNSIVSCVHQARENARSVRETISSEMWEHLNEFYFNIYRASKDPTVKEHSSDFFEEVKMASHLFKGITDATMSHGEGWHFSRVGRLIERADKTSRILDVKYYILLPSVQDVGTPADNLQWSALLRSVSGFEMYRKRYHGLSPRRVIQFLVLDRDFPRSINHCVITADESLHKISGSDATSFCNSAEQRMGQLRSELAYVLVDDVVNEGLHEFLDRLQSRLNGIGDSIYETFITMRPVDETAPIP